MGRKEKLRQHGSRAPEPAPGPDAPRAAGTARPWPGAGAGQTLVPAGAGTWPLIASWRTSPDALLLSGRGGLALARREPAGTACVALALLDFARAGIREARLLSGLDPALLATGITGELAQATRFRVTGASEEELSRLLWGAVACQIKQGGRGDLAVREAFRILVPPPPGMPTEWWRDLCREDGEVRPEFIERAREAAREDDEADGDILLVTRAVFEVDHVPTLLLRIMIAGAEFQPEEGTRGRRMFRWRPAQGDVPAGEADAIGILTIDPPGAVFTSPTPAAAGRFADWLVKVLPGQHRLTGFQWEPAAA